MSPALQELQMKKIRLENELQALNEKERVLMDKIRLLETVSSLEVKLRKLKENGNESSKYPKDPNKAQVWPQKPKQNKSTAGTVLTSESGSKLNRVRLKGNAVFSWSYQKLP